MNYRASSGRGVLIAIHRRIRGVWLARLFVLILCVSPVTAAEATIAASGNVSSIVPLGPGNTTFPSVVDTRVVAVGIDNGIGSLTVNGGNILTVQGAGSGINIGGDYTLIPGFGTVTIDGPGSKIETLGPGGFMNVGRFGTTSTAALHITNGGVLNTTIMNWPRGDFAGGNAGTTSILVDGPGSAIHLSGNDAAGRSAAFNNRDGGTGTLTLRNGASMSVSAPAATLNGPGGILGLHAGGSGTLNVESGATLTVTTNTLGGGFTVGESGTGTINVTGSGSSILIDGSAPGALTFLVFGGNAGSTGTLSISDGATFTLDRNGPGPCCITFGGVGSSALSITSGGKLIVNNTSGTVGAILFGGNAFTPTSAPFSALVSGAGSALTYNGLDANITVGRENGASGTMTVNAGAAVTARTFNIARNVGSTATLDVAGVGTTLNLIGGAAGVLGAALNVGVRGIGTANVSGGAIVTIDASATPNAAGVRVGGNTGVGGGGTGTLTVSGAGSRVDMLGGTAHLWIGTDPTGGTTPSAGTVTIASGGQMILDQAAGGGIGNSPGSSGALTVTGADSLLDTGAFLGVGKDSAGGPGGTGTLTVSAGGTVKATAIQIGPAGTLNGSGGTIVGNVVNLGGTVNPGQSAGRLSIIGNYESVGGKLVVEVDASGNYDVLTVVGTATFDVASLIEIKIDPGFQPAVGTSLDVVQVKATLADPAQSLLTVQVQSGGGGATTQGPLSSLPTTVSVVSVPATPLALAVDILPGVTPNILNAQAQGPLPVAILGSPAFAVSEIDPATITLAAPGVGLSATANPALCTVMDVNGDQIADLLCYLTRGGGESLGVATATLSALTTAGIPAQGTDSITVVNHALVLGGLGPAMVWIGEKENSGAPIRLDVLAEVRLGTTLVGQGQINNVATGTAGFNNAVLHTIPLSLLNGPVPFPGGTALEFKVSARRTTCPGTARPSGPLVLWYNGRPVDSGPQRDAGTGFTATVDGVEAEYFLRDKRVLSPLAGSVRQFAERMVNSSQRCPDPAFTPFGTWTITP